MPPSPALYTSDFPNKDVWSADNLPAVLFYLQLPANPLHDIKPETFVRQDGLELRKFHILPDYISVDVEGLSRKFRNPTNANQSRLAYPRMAMQ